MAEAFQKLRDTEQHLADLKREEPLCAAIAAKSGILAAYPSLQNLRRIFAAFLAAGQAAISLIDESQRKKVQQAQKSRPLLDALNNLRNIEHHKTLLSLGNTTCIVMGPGGGSRTNHISIDSSQLALLPGFNQKPKLVEALTMKSIVEFAEEATAELRAFLQDRPWEKTS